jgi:hypothetical protein
MVCGLRRVKEQMRPFPTVRRFCLVAQPRERCATSWTVSVMTNGVGWPIRQVIQSYTQTTQCRLDPLP